MKKVIILLFVLALLATNVPAQASLIVYTGTATMSGTLGSTSFSDALTTFTTIADTNTMQHLVATGVEAYANTGITTVQINGVGTATFSGGTYGVVSEVVTGFGPFDIIGFYTGTGAPLLLSASAYTPPMYDLKTSFTVTAPLSLNSYPKTLSTTNLGNLTITSATGDLTFTAIPTPEPSTYALLCISLGVVGFARKKMGKA